MSDTPELQPEAPLSRRSPRTSPSQKEFKLAAAHFLNRIGGVDNLLDVLDHSTDPKAKRLADALRANSDDLSKGRMSFGNILTSSGTDIDDFTRIFGSVRRSQATTLVLDAGPEITHHIVERAKPRWVSCSGCWQTGYVLDDDSEPTDKLHSVCQGKGWVLVEPDKFAVETSLNIAGLAKPGGDMYVDARKLQLNQTAIFGSAPGAAPDVLEVIRRADSKEYNVRQLSAPAEELPDTTDYVPVEAEVVG